MEKNNKETKMETSYSSLWLVVASLCGSPGYFIDVGYLFIIHFIRLSLCSVYEAHMDIGKENRMDYSCGSAHVTAPWQALSSLRDCIHRVMMPAKRSYSPNEFQMRALS